MQDETLSQAAQELCLHIAIDGPAGAGKSTVGRALSGVLGCSYIDTGLMYRAVTLIALQDAVTLTDGEALGHLARSISFDYAGDLFVNGRPAPEALRGPRVDAHVSEVSAHQEVREVMVARQRELTRGRCAVMVGRDIGTVVLPHAPVKLWVTASAQERARRRQSERLPGSQSFDEAAMLRQIEARDALDAGREVSPLRQASGAVIIETDRLTPKDALDAALSAVRRAVEHAGVSS